MSKVAILLETNGDIRALDVLSLDLTNALRDLFRNRPVHYCKAAPAGTVLVAGVPIDGDEPANENATKICVHPGAEIFGNAFMVKVADNRFTAFKESEVEAIIHEWFVRPNAEGATRDAVFI